MNIYPIQDQSLLQLTGEDAARFLQGQVTCDVEKLSNGASSMAAHCNPKGRVISLFHLLKAEDCFYLSLPTSMLALTQQSLGKYLVFFKSQFNVIDKHSSYGITFDADETGERLPPLPKDSKVFQLAGQGTRYQVFSSNPIDTNANTTWEHDNILSGCPIIYPETSGQFLPHELNLPSLGGVSFKKGCYTGQEIISRMHHLGKIKTHLYQAQTPQLFHNGQPLVKEDSQPMGYIVNIALNAQNYYTCLANLKEVAVEKKHDMPLEQIKRCL